MAEDASRAAKKAAEWWVEAGIGETRAALIEGDRILEARILPEGALLAGTIIEARLVARMPERGQGVVAWADGEALVAPLPVGVTQGALTLVEIVRPAISEPGKPKRALARPATSTTVRAEPVEARPKNTLPSAELRTGIDMLRANGAEGGRMLQFTDPDLLEAAGWSELLEQAATGAVNFSGGALDIASTPAMTVIDVDGILSAPQLAVAGARAAAEAIRRLDITGSIGIDLPVSGDKAVRAAAAEAIDAVLPQPFERTAVNGFGFVQIVRRRTRHSLIELYTSEPALAHARALLRVAERTGGSGERTVTAHPAVIAEVERRPAWVTELMRRLGVAVALRPDPRLAISAGHVQARHP